MTAGLNPILLDIDGRSRSIETALEEIQQPEIVLLHHFDTNLDLAPLKDLESRFTVIIEDSTLDVFTLGPIAKSPVIVLIIRNCEFLNSTIDLSPLTRTKGQCYLRALHLLNNDLHHIDLEPMRNCKHLESLSISNNPNLSTINLTPLRDCHALKTIKLDENPLLNNLDLIPLGPCRDLEEIDIQGTVIDRLDITAIIPCYSSSNPQILHDPSCQVIYDSGFQNLYSLPSDFTPVVTDGEATRRLIVEQHTLTRERFTSITNFVVSPKFLLGMSFSFFGQVMIQFMFETNAFILLSSILGAIFFILGGILLAKQ